MNLMGSLRSVRRTSVEPSVGMSFKTVWKLKQSLNKSRQRIKQRELSQLMNQVDSFSG
jgi:hypothetical protein